MLGEMPRCEWGDSDKTELSNRSLICCLDKVHDAIEILFAGAAELAHERLQSGACQGHVDALVPQVHPVHPVGRHADAWRRVDGVIAWMLELHRILLEALTWLSRLQEIDGGQGLVADGTALMTPMVPVSGSHLRSRRDQLAASR